MRSLHRRLRLLIRFSLNDHWDDHGLTAQAAGDPCTNGTAHNLLKLLYRMHLLGRAVKRILKGGGNFGGDLVEDRIVFGDYRRA